MVNPDAPKRLTAAELDAMSPNERAQAFRERILTDLEQLPAGFRERVEQTARDLGTQASQAS